jgi:hypothetical protein
MGRAGGGEEQESRQSSQQGSVEREAELRRSGCFVRLQRSLVFDMHLLNTVIPQSRCGIVHEPKNLKAALGDLLFASN